jgi:hypothetical protein
VNVQTKPPLPSVAIAVPVCVQSEPPVGVWTTPANVTVAPDVWLGVKPVPVTVYVVLSGPCVGLTTIEGVIIVNVPDAVLPRGSVATTLVPDGPFRTLTLLEPEFGT